LWTNGGLSPCNNADRQMRLSHRNMRVNNTHTTVRRVNIQHMLGSRKLKA
jgi:hypothetical protein